MALEYQLNLQTKLIPDRLLERLEPFAGGSLGMRTFMSSELEKALTTTSFGFESDVGLIFRIGDSPEGAHALLVQAVDRALLETRGDASMLFNGEVPVLRRRRGEVEVNSDYLWLDDEVRPYFTRCYTTVTMPRL